MWWLLEVSLKMLAINREFFSFSLQIFQSISSLTNFFLNLEWA